MIVDSVRDQIYAKLCYKSDFFDPNWSFNYTTVNKCQSPNMTVIVKTARPYFDRRQEMRDQMAEIKFKGDVFFVVGTEENEDNATTVKATVLAIISY